MRGLIGRARDRCEGDASTDGLIPLTTRYTFKHRRTGTAVCKTDVEIGLITDGRLLQLYVKDPAFGL